MCTIVSIFENVKLLLENIFVRNSPKACSLSVCLCNVKSSAEISRGDNKILSLCVTLLSLTQKENLVVCQVWLNVYTVDQDRKF